MRIGIAVNPQKEQSASAVRSVARLLAAFGCSGVFDEAAKSALSDTPARFSSDPIEGSDLLLVIGGDGTILRYAVKAAERGIPVLGVNTGSVGFLADCDPHSLEAAFRDLTQGDFALEERVMLETSVGGKRCRALNDIAVVKGRSDTMLRLAVEVNGEPVDRFRADGFLIATPTGSTAYALSCGGPILSPSVNALVLAPICSHSLRTRPVVISVDDTVRITAESPMYPTIDGHPCGDGVGELTVGACDVRAKFVKLGHASFFEKLNNKLDQWSRS